MVIAARFAPGVREMGGTKRDAGFPGLIDRAAVTAVDTRLLQRAMRISTRVSFDIDSCGCRATPAEDSCPVRVGAARRKERWQTETDRDRAEAPRLLPGSALAGVGPSRLGLDGSPWPRMPASDQTSITLVV